MDLINRLPHKRNTSVKVNGTKYEIDGSGIVRGVSDADAAKMQSSGDYKLHIERTPMGAPAPAPVLMDEEKTPVPQGEEAVSDEEPELPPVPEDDAPPAEAPQAEAKKKARKHK